MKATKAGRSIQVNGMRRFGVSLGMHFSYIEQPFFWAGKDNGMNSSVWKRVCVYAEGVGEGRRGL